MVFCWRFVAYVPDLRTKSNFPQKGRKGRQVKMEEENRKKDRESVGNEDKIQEGGRGET